MLEILLVIWIVRIFKKAAIQYNQKPWLWQVIGGSSYLVPTYLMAFLIAPMILQTYAPNHLGFSILSVIVSVGVGAGVSMLVLQGMKKAVQKENWQEQVLDQE